MRKEIFYFDHNTHDHIDCPWDEEEHGENREFEVEVPDYEVYQLQMKHDGNIDSMLINASIDLEEINKEAENKQYKYVYLFVSQHFVNLRVESKHDSQDVLLFDFKCRL